MTIGLIYNPIAGTRGLSADFRTEAESILLGQYPGSRLDFRPTQYAGHATELAREMVLAGFDSVFAAGGDGTMNEVAAGLLHSHTALGLLPLGSGNGLARHIGLPLDLLDAWKVQLGSPAVSMDSGTANRRPFFLAAGIGFEGVVAHRFATKSGRGFFQYLLSSSEEFFRYKPIPCRIQVDGGEEQDGRFFTSVFANGSQYGNNAWISPGSEIDDGLFQWVQIRPFPLWAAPGLFRRLMTRSLPGSPYWHSRSFSELKVSSPVSIRGHLDGEPVNFGNTLEIRVLPASLRFLRPKKN
jgi:YegS/Rv2252/BmrU family lipid kinase